MPDSRTLVERFYGEVWNRRDYAVADDILAADFRCTKKLDPLDFERHSQLVAVILGASSLRTDSARIATGAGTGRHWPVQTDRFQPGAGVSAGEDPPPSRR